MGLVTHVVLVNAMKERMSLMNDALQIVEPNAENLAALKMAFAVWGMGVVLFLALQLIGAIFTLFGFRDD